jgi:hypothetical protein
VAIVYPLNMPAGGPSSVRFSPVNHVAETVSPFTGSTQTLEWPAEYLGLQLTLPRMARDTAAQWIAFLTALRGKAGTFLAGPTGAESTPRGLLGGTPLVRNSNATGSKTLTTKGWTINKANVLRAGDWIQVGTQLFMVVTDASSDASGFATLDIFPRLRSTFADGTAIVTTNPKGIFRLAENVRSWEIDSARHYSITINAREAL